MSDATRVIGVGSRPHDWCNRHALELNVGEACPLCRQDGAQHRSTENDRWWQAFCAIETIAPNLEGLAERKAAFADHAVAEAKKRGRL